MDQFDSQQKSQGETKNSGLSREGLAKKFGDSLRESREAAGFTIERAAIATKISLPFIQALESGELHRLPGAVFARGFIRNLCKIYQKDASSFLGDFERALGHVEPVAASVAEPETVERQGAASDDETVPAATVAKTDSASTETAASPLGDTLQQQVKVWREKLETYLPLLRSQRNQLIAGAAVGAVLVSVLTFFVTNPGDEQAEKTAQQAQPSQMPVVAEEQPPAPQGVPEENGAAHQAESQPAVASKPEEVVATNSVDNAALLVASIPSPKIETAHDAKVVKPQGVKAETLEAKAEKSPEIRVEKSPEPPPEDKVVAAKKSETPKQTIAQRSERAPVINKPEPVRQTPATRQTIEILARERVVVRLVKDGGAPQNITLEPKQHSFEFRDEAQVLIFDASVVDVKYNGRSLGPLGKRGRIRRLSFKREELPVHAKM